MADGRAVYTLRVLVKNERAEFVFRTPRPSRAACRRDPNPSAGCKIRIMAGSIAYARSYQLAISDYGACRGSLLCGVRALGAGRIRHYSASTAG